MLNEIHEDPHLVSIQLQRRVIAYTTHVSMVIVGLCEVVSEDTKTGLLLSAADHMQALLEHADTTLLPIQVKCCY